MSLETSLQSNALAEKEACLQTDQSHARDLRLETGFRLELLYYPGAGAKIHLSQFDHPKSKLSTDI